MASLLFAGGVLAYEKIKDAKAKKVARKAHNEARYNDLQSSTCTCTSTSSSTSTPSHNPFEEEKEKFTKGCPVHDPEMRRKGLKEEVERERGELIRGSGEKGVYVSDADGEGDDATRGTVVDGKKGGEEPPRYEDVAAPPPVGFKERMRRKGKGEERVVR